MLVSVVFTPHELKNYKLALYTPVLEVSNSPIVYYLALLVFVIKDLLKVLKYTPFYIIWRFILSQ